MHQLRYCYTFSKIELWYNIVDNTRNVLYNVDTTKIKGVAIMEMAFAQENSSDENADYKKLYFAAVNKLTDISHAIDKAQQELEGMYLNQTEPSGIEQGFN